MSEGGQIRFAFIAKFVWEKWNMIALRPRQVLHEIKTSYNGTGCYRRYESVRIVERDCWWRRDIFVAVALRGA